jgi:hypothetical protein
MEVTDKRIDDATARFKKLLQTRLGAWQTEQVVMNGILEVFKASMTAEFKDLCEQMKDLTDEVLLEYGQISQMTPEPTMSEPKMEEPKIMSDNDILMATPIGTSATVTIKNRPTSVHPELTAGRGCVGCAYNPKSCWLVIDTACLAKFHCSGESVLFALDITSSTPGGSK